MAITTKKYKWTQYLGGNDLLLIHPETEAELVLYDDSQTNLRPSTVTDSVITVQSAIEYIQSAIDAINNTIQGGAGIVTGIKGSSESDYRTGNVILTKANIGLGNVDNTSDANKPISTATQTALNSKADKTELSNYIPTSQKGVANGVASLGTDGKVPSSQLPSYVDDVLEYANKTSFPTTGETGKIYVDMATNLTYRWSGTAYTEISPSLALGETSSTAFPGNRGKTLETKVSQLETNYGTLDGDVDDLQNAFDSFKTRNIVATDEHPDDPSKQVDVFARADEANNSQTTVKLKNKITFSLSGDATGTSAQTDLSGNVSIPATIGNLKVTEGKLAADSVTRAKIKDGEVVSSKLANSGVTAGTYSAVKVNAKGLVTEGGQFIEIGTAGQTTPSENLVVGGLFLMEI